MKTRAVLPVIFSCFLFCVIANCAVNSGAGLQRHGSASGNEILIKGLEYSAVTDNYRTYYEIFVGAFSDSNNDGIGDIRGLINRLDYLNDGLPDSGRSLGIEGIWLMPIMRSPSYHKYDVIDYYSIDPRYGVMEDFDELLAECEKRGIRLIIDLVLNHTSSQNQWFLNAKSAVRAGDFDDPYAKYYVLEPERIAGRTWYPFEKTPDGRQYYYEGNFSSQMPELDFDNPDVRREIIDIVRFWLEKGIGGFRLDAVKYVYFGEDKRNIDFFNWFASECHRIKEDVYIVAENWSGIVSIQDYYEAVNCFDFGMSGTSGDVYFAVQGFSSVTEFAQRLTDYQRRVLEKNPGAVLNPFISNHDMDRAAGFLSVDDYLMHTAANLYILSSGSPFIYYGEEIGMKGSRGSANTDANRRLAMLWGDNDTVKNPAGSTYSSANQTNGTVKEQAAREDSLLMHYKKLIRLRNNNPEIARGIVIPLDFSQYDTFGGFISDYNGSRAAVFHNTASNEVKADLSLYSDITFTSVRGFAGKGSASLNGSILTLSGYTSVVLK